VVLRRVDVEPVRLPLGVGLRGTCAPDLGKLDVVINDTQPLILREQVKQDLTRKLQASRSYINLRYTTEISPWLGPTQWDRENYVTGKLFHRHR
jgi:hypothetical protein